MDNLHELLSDTVQQLHTLASRLLCWVSPLLALLSSITATDTCCSIPYNQKLTPRGTATLWHSSRFSPVYILLSCASLASLACGKLLALPLWLDYSSLQPSSSTNRWFAPLEQYLPFDLALESEDDEQAPLLSSAEEGEADTLRNTESSIQRLSSRTRVPSKVVTPIAQFLQPHIFASHTAMKAWLREGDFDADDAPEYSEEDVKKAYLHPAYTSKTPIVWLAKDNMGVSKNEAQENETEGIKCSDEGAWIDGKGNLKWSVYDFEEVPIFKKGTRW
jgi:hypothetical protein